MIEAIAELFVERVPARSRALAPAVRLLVVDATGRIDRLRDLLSALEERGPVSVSLVRLEDLDQPPMAVDAIWLVAGDDGDPAYCALVHGELEARFPGVSVELLTVGADIEAAALKGGPHWRRKAATSAAAAALEARLAR